MPGEETLITIDVVDPLKKFVAEPHFAKRLPPETEEFRKTLTDIYIPQEHYEKLYGGHRNLVLRDTATANVLIVWRQHEIRWDHLIRAVLTEHVISEQLGIPGRQLVDPTKPVEINEWGHYVTKVRYVPGEDRYPWIRPEIESAAVLLSHLHHALRHITFDSRFGHIADEGEEQWTHGDAARANILFDRNTATASVVIDYENLEPRSREQDIARTLSLLLIDTQLRRHDQSLYVPSEYSRSLETELSARTEALLDTYPTTIALKKDTIIAWTRGYLESEVYGSLNHMAHLSLEYLMHKYPTVMGKRI